MPKRKRARPQKNGANAAVNALRIEVDGSPTADACRLSGWAWLEPVGDGDSPDIRRSRFIAQREAPDAPWKVAFTHGENFRPMVEAYLQARFR